MVSPQYAAPEAIARDIWKYAPWAREESFRHFWAKLSWLIPTIVAIILFLPLALFAPQSVAFAIDLGAFAGGILTVFFSAAAEAVRASNQRAYIVQQLLAGVDATQLRPMPQVAGRPSFALWLFIANAIIFFVAGGAVTAIALALIKP